MSEPITTTIARWLRAAADWLDGGAMYSNAPLWVEHRRVIDLRYMEVVQPIALRNAVLADDAVRIATRNLLRQVSNAASDLTKVVRRDDIESGGVVLTARLQVVEASDE